MEKKANHNSNDTMWQLNSRAIGIACTFEWNSIFECMFAVANWSDKENESKLTHITISASSNSNSNSPVNLNGFIRCLDDKMRRVRLLFLDWCVMVPLFITTKKCFYNENLIKRFMFFFREIQNSLSFSQEFFFRIWNFFLRNSESNSCHCDSKK